VVHCSIWRFTGDPDDLERRYLALMSEVPETNNVLHAAARTPDGLIMFDTCPSREAYHEFFARDDVRALFARHGLTGGAVEDHPVIAAYARRSRVDTLPWDEA
jgi:hypothetical protein